MNQKAQDYREDLEDVQATFDELPENEQPIFMSLHFHGAKDLRNGHCGLFQSH